MPTSAPSAGRVLGDYIAEQRDAILSGDAALRRGDDTVIHATRVATRRLRSTLRMFGPLFDPERAAWLDTELKWYAALLGEVRDRQVLRRRLDAMIDDVEPSLLLGPVRDRVDGELFEQQSQHWDQLSAELSGARYAALVAALDAWVEHPPDTAEARRRAGRLIKRVERAKRVVRRRLARAVRTGEVEQLHTARKAAKRARYAVEATASLIGPKRARRDVHTYRHLQDVLGEHQDSVVSADVLRRLGAAAGAAPGENGFAFGILHEREQQRARRARRQAKHTIKAHL